MQVVLARNKQTNELVALKVGGRLLQQRSNLLWLGATAGMARDPVTWREHPCLVALLLLLLPPPGALGAARAVGDPARCSAHRFLRLPSSLPACLLGLLGLRACLLGGWGRDVGGALEVGAPNPAPHHARLHLFCHPHPPLPLLQVCFLGGPDCTLSPPAAAAGVLS